MPQPPQLSVTHTSTVTADQIDELGHMNVRWYGHNAVAATRAMCEQLGLPSADPVSTYTRHHHEQLEGSNLEVRSGLLPDGARLRFFHELRNRADNDLAATFVHELDHPCLEAPGIDIPEYGQPRSLSLDADLLAAAPSLDEVQSRELAIRYKREVDTEDTAGGDQVPAWLANNLIWGGDRPNADAGWIVDMPDGSRMAYATMESRLSVGRLPTLGTRIQSFGALIELGTKITRSINWAYDLDTAEPLVAFDVINLAFNINERRSMEIPPDIRENEQARLQPDLAPAR